jgi:hypothetical protein
MPYVCCGGTVARSHTAPVLGIALRASSAARSETDGCNLFSGNLQLDRRGRPRRFQCCFNKLIVAAIAAGMRRFDLADDFLGTRRRQQRTMPETQRCGIRCEKSITILTEIDHR